MIAPRIIRLVLLGSCASLSIANVASGADLPPIKLEFRPDALHLSRSEQDRGLKALVAARKDAALFMATFPKATCEAWQPDANSRRTRMDLRCIVEEKYTVKVTTYGNVRQPYVINSTNPKLDAAALAAIKQWKFKPAMKNARYMTSRMRVPFVF